MKTIKAFATKTMFLATLFISPFVSVQDGLNGSSQAPATCACACTCHSSACNKCASKQQRRTGRKRLVRKHICNRRRRKKRARKAKKIVA